MLLAYIFLSFVTVRLPVCVQVYSTLAVPGFSFHLCDGDVLLSIIGDYGRITPP